MGQSSIAFLPSGPIPSATEEFTEEVRELGITVQMILHRVLKSSSSTTAGPSSSSSSKAEDGEKTRKISRRQSNLLENLTQEIIKDLDFPVYKNSFRRLWTLFRLEPDEEMVNIFYAKQFNRKSYLEKFSRELYNKLQLQAIEVGLDIFNDVIVDKSIID